MVAGRPYGRELTLSVPPCDRLRAHFEHLGNLADRVELAGHLAAKQLEDGTLEVAAVATDSSNVRQEPLFRPPRDRSGICIEHLAYLSGGHELVVHQFGFFHWEFPSCSVPDFYII